MDPISALEKLFQEFQGGCVREADDFKVTGVLSGKGIMVLNHDKDKTRLKIIGNPGSNFQSCSLVIQATSEKAIVFGSAFPLDTEFGHLVARILTRYLELRLEDDLCPLFSGLIEGGFLIDERV